MNLIFDVDLSTGSINAAMHALFLFGGGHETDITEYKSGKHLIQVLVI